MSHMLTPFPAFDSLDLKDTADLRIGKILSVLNFVMLQKGPPGRTDWTKHQQVGELEAAMVERVREILYARVHYTGDTAPELKPSEAEELLLFNTWKALERVASERG